MIQVNLTQSGLIACLALNSLGYATVYYNLTVLPPLPESTGPKIVEIERHVPVINDEAYYLLTGLLIILLIGIVACCWCCRSATQIKARKTIIFQKQIIVDRDGNSKLALQNQERDSLNKGGIYLGRDSDQGIEPMLGNGSITDSLAPIVYIEGRHVEVAPDKLDYYKEYMFKFPMDPLWEIARQE